MPDPSSAAHHSLHMVDMIHKKRDGKAHAAHEIAFIAHGAADGSIPLEQLSAWLMAAFLRGLSIDETRTLTLAMRDSGEKFDPSGLGKSTVDKHSTGGVGDKTSFLVAPIAAACGLAVPMISGRALGHTGGTLDKLESIPGYNTQLSLAEFEDVLARCGASIIGQSPRLVPADRVLYALRDRTATVEHRSLICASILSKKLAAGLDALVLDVKTGSGAFLRQREECEFLAALMVVTAESAGTRTVALLTDMDQPLGCTAGNWIEIAECIELMRGKSSDQSEDLRELSLHLAGWMLYLGGAATTPVLGYDCANAALCDGSALKAFYAMVEAHGGDLAVFADPAAFHKPGATQELTAWKTGYIHSIDTTAIGWAVQRLGAGREKAGEPVDPHAGIRFHARRGAFLEEGQPLATLYATSVELLAEPMEILHRAIIFSKEPPPAAQLISHIFNRESAMEYLKSREQGSGNRDQEGTLQ
jgi:pyrimidine-nucleoside phosphorylase